MKLNINQTSGALKWPQIIKKSFDFKNGQGFTQLNLSCLFTIKDCKNIFKNFNSNLNWIIRDSQKIKVPKNQVPTSKYLVKVMDFFRQLLQKNIPEKNHVHLILETLRVARSDGTQHQVGSRWHQDHEAYFSLLINLTEYWDANSSTNFYHLEPNEKYKLNTLGNPILEKHWKKDYVKPFHLGIINSGLRYFFFPFDKCRPISHMAPVNTKRLAIFATFSISGIEQGMDLKDIYIPLSKSKKDTSLKNLRNYWRKILGIDKSIRTTKVLRKSNSKYGLYKINSIMFDIFKKHFNKKKKKYSQYRIVNFGLKQFQSDLSNKKRLLHKTIAIGELSRSLKFFSDIGEFSIKKLIKTNKKLIKLKECSLLGNNNFDLFVMFKQPKKAFQLLSMKKILKHVEEFILVLYKKPDNYICSKRESKLYNKQLPFEQKDMGAVFNFNKKKKIKDKIAQIFTSFQFNYPFDLKKKNLLAHSLKEVRKKGVQQIIANKKNNHFIVNKKNIIFNLKLKNIDKVPFFLPRLGIDRKLPEVNASSQLIKSSKKILSKKSI